MCVPHNNRCSFSLRVPYAFIFAVIALTAFGSFHLYGISKDAAMYPETKAELDYYVDQFQDMKSTLTSLQMADQEFKRLFVMETKEEVLDNINTTDSGAFEMEILRSQIEETIANVGDIRDYLSLQRDLYRSTPMGKPVNGWFSSSYGRRMHPIRGTRDFHTGLDISARPKTAVKVTADGIVTFSARSGANGNLVAVEHGFGYSTYYAHNKKNLVKVGQIVKRGDTIAQVGSTGSSTGPHVHYEISKDGKSLNPKKFIKGGSW